ncbi:hypothetical protein K1T71_002458 [Dendrolimus kikuchii]|uniref:Uncharacterized protein n=1 Tax=Dendrolimus kikuchii TaxID=765133 RepID=A0ACC1DD31_9NEOP|nr:hypothetical protein K1T71_002458 [Dendrolimus kikuchii]
MNVRPLTPALQKKAEEELNEKPERILEDLNTFKTWIADHPNLKSIKLPDQWLMAFLRGSKYNFDKCKSKFERYYALKTEFPELFANRDPLHPKIQELLKLGIYLPLRKCVKEDSPRICLSRISLLQSAGMTLLDITKIGFMIVEIMLLEDDNFTVAGQEVVCDLKDVGIRILSQWTPSFAKKIVVCSERALSVRLKSVHVVNAPRGIKWVIAIFKIFIGAKMKSRISVYDANSVEVYNVVPKSILPVEFGGEDGSVQELIDYWKAKVESYRDWFLECEIPC